jgi:hypothetical protein
MKRSFLGSILKIALIAILGVVILGASAQESLAAPKVLIAHADPGGAPVTELMATGLFAVVDVFDATWATPTLAELAPYDAVLAYTNYPPYDAVSLGNVLADYVDGGGCLVICTYSFSNPWEILGRITTTGYSPLVNLAANADVSGNLVAVIPTDPIFSGVNLGTLQYFHNGNFAHPGLDTGATLLATDGSGTNLIARNGSGRVIGANLFPGTADVINSEFYKLMANMLLCQSTKNVPAMTGGGAVLFGTLLVLSMLLVIRRRAETL